ncbi:MAG: hypothetical protein JWQ65_649, partial [Devosia sp.]|nr:hypothetical protein [Devosia sp.]
MALIKNIDEDFALMPKSDFGGMMALDKIDRKILTLLQK